MVSAFWKRNVTTTVECNPRSSESILVGQISMLTCPLIHERNGDRLTPFEPLRRDAKRDHLKPIHSRIPGVLFCICIIWSSRIPVELFCICISWPSIIPIELFCICITWSSRIPDLFCICIIWSSIIPIDLFCICISWP